MKRLLVLGVVVLMGAAPFTAPSPYGFPWRGPVPVTITIADHTSSAWRPVLEQLAAEWSASTVIDVVLLPSDGVCNAKAKLTICDGSYGQGDLHWGWTVYSNRNGYMTDAAVYLNDSYLDTALPDDRIHVACHEMGNALGLLADRSCTEYQVNGGSIWRTYPTDTDFSQLLDVYGP